MASQIDNFPKKQPTNDNWRTGIQLKANLSNSKKENHNLDWETFINSILKRLIFIS